MTEHYFDTDNMSDIVAMSKELHDCMVTGNMNAYVYWWITWPNGLATSSGTIYKRAYILGQFAKFIRPGYYRVDATANPTSNIYISAYTGNGKAVIVAVNTGNTAVNQSFNIQNGTLKTVTPYTTDNTRNMVTGTNITVNNNTFTAQLPAQSVTTFVGDMGNYPTVKFTSPTANTVYTLGTPITLSANATISSGTIANVQFYDGTTLLNTDNSTPYTYTWTNATSGKHSLKVVATDNVGNTSTDTLSIKVNVPQGPFGNNPWPIPGTIQFENFDVGGNGIAYNDGATGNTGGATFRTDEDVDIENCTDAGGGYNIGFATAGEWLEYTVNVTKSDVYELVFRVACNGSGRTISLSMDETNIATNVSIPNTGGWQTWQTVTIPNIALTAGQKVMRLTVGATDYVNLNYISFSSVVTGIEENSTQSNLTIYPNPFTNKGLQINQKGTFKYLISTINGITIESGVGIDSKTVGNDLATGTYVLSIENENRVSVQKIVKQ